MSELELQGRLNEACRDLDIDGGAVALVSPSQRLFAANEKGAHGFSVTTPIEIGCLAKPITATLLTALSREGLLSLGSPVSRFLRRRSSLFAKRLSKIRIHHLLCHTHGLEEAEFAAAPVLSDGMLDLEAICRSACAQPPIAEPGEIFSYSSTGYWIAAGVAERVCGSAFRNLLHTRLLRHLGVEREPRAGCARRPICPSQGTGLLLSTVELARFVALHLGLEDLAVPHLNDEEVISRMHTAHAALPGWGAGTEAVGMGWKAFYEGWTGHSGFSGEFGAAIRLNRKQRLGLAVVVRGERNRNVMSLAARLFGQLLPEFRMVKQWPAESGLRTSDVVGEYGNRKRRLVIDGCGPELQVLVSGGGSPGVGAGEMRAGLVRIQEGLYRVRGTSAMRPAFLQIVTSTDRTEAAYVWDGQRVWPRLRNPDVPAAAGSSVGARANGGPYAT